MVSHGGQYEFIKVVKYLPYSVMCRQWPCISWLLFRIPDC